MGRFLTTILMILTASSTVGCYSCMQSSYYDPCSGVVYGPSIQSPTIFSGLKKSKHDEKNCPLCQADGKSLSHADGVNCGPACHQGAHHAETCACGNTHATPVNGAVNPACYGAAFGPEPGCEAPAPVTGHCGCAAPNPIHARHDCSCNASHGGCRCGGHEATASWSPTIDTMPRCTACGQVVHDSIPADCPTCSTFPGEYYSGEFHLPDTVYDSYDSPAYSDSTVLPGELVLPDTFAPSDCPTCQPGVSGPLFEGTIIPNDSAATPGSPTPQPAPPAESENHHSHEHSTPPATPLLETAPGATPEPDPLPATTLLIPADSTLQPARHVHWVPNAVK